MAIHVTKNGVALTVGIIILTGLLISGLFWVRSAGEQARRSDAVTAAEQNLTDETNKNVAIDSDGSNGDSSAKSDSSSSTSGSTSGSSSDSSSSNSSTSNSSSNSNTATTETSELPQTGPADAVFVAIMLGVSTYVAASYVQSRQRARA